MIGILNKIAQSIKYKDHQQDNVGITL